MPSTGDEHRSRVLGTGAHQPSKATEGKHAMATLRRAGFVYAEGAEFKLDGQPFRHVGVNISQLVYQPYDQLIRELNGAQDANVRHVRVWLPNDLMQGQIVTRLRRVLDNALARGIRVTVALTHNYFGGSKGDRG